VTPHQQAAYNSAAPRMPGVSADEFEALFAIWEYHPVTVDGRPAGAIMVNANELHACVEPWAFGRWISKSLLRVLTEVIQQYGYAVTHVALGNEQGAKFVQRLGFELHNTANGVNEYRSTKQWASKQQS
jgi:hypothetical protein